MTQDHHTRKKQCDITAHQLYHGTVESRLAYLDALSKTIQSEERNAMDQPQPDPNRISIWQRQGSEFVRPKPSPLGDHYASKLRFPVTKSENTCRICFFGESVAAGYLYAPQITPADILEKQLNAHSNTSYEIIDLARTNERLETLHETVAQSMVLKPDALVLWVGNNWNLLENPELSPLVPDAEARRRFANILKESGYEGPLSQGVHRILEKATHVFDSIYKYARTASVPVFLMVPATNLLTWETLQPPMLAPGKALHEWYKRFDACTEYLVDKNWQMLRDTAMEMLNYDEGTCPTTFRLLGLSYLGENRKEHARESLLAEVDSSHYASLAFLSAPQSGSFVHNLLRRIANQQNFTLIDLPHEFMSIDGTALTDSEHFLDYCHHSLKGLKIAMGATSHRILKHFENQDIASETLRNTPIEVDPEVMAVANFGAALHNAHRGCFVQDKTPIITKYCRMALLEDPSYADIMLDYVKVRLSRVPAGIHKAQDRQLQRKVPLLHQHGWHYEHIDAFTIKGIQEALPLSHKKQLLAIVHRFPNLKKQLADPYYLFEPLHQFYSELMGFDDIARPVYLRSPWPDQGFALIVDSQKHDLECQLTARIPQTQERQHITVTLNNVSISQCQIGQQWTKVTFKVPSRRLRPGIQRLGIRWPVPQDFGESPLKQVIANLENGRPSALHPIFGEVFSLKVFIADTHQHQSQVEP